MVADFPTTMQSFKAFLNTDLLFVSQIQKIPVKNCKIVKDTCMEKHKNDSCKKNL